MFIYLKKLNDIFIILVLYVDDMLILRKIMDEINRLKAQMARNFDMKDLGAVKQILDIEIHRDRRNGKISFSQEKYVEKILERFEMNKANCVNVPLCSHFKLYSILCPSSVEEKDYMSCVPYANTLGCLMYAMVCTRPDISHAIDVVSKYMENPGKDHWNAVIWMLQYLRGTSDYCTTFNNNSDSVCSFVDSDFAGDLDKKMSTSSYVFTLIGGAISWMSKLAKRQFR